MCLIDNQPNEFFSNAKRSALKVGYSDSYAGKILSRIERQNNVEGKKVVKVRKSLIEAMDEQGINTKWIATLIFRLGNKNEKRIINGRLVDTGEPESQSAKTALEFIAKTQGLYTPDHSVDKFESYTKEQLTDLIISGIYKTN